MFRAVAAVVFAFLASRCLYYTIGVRFEQSLLFYAWQFLDVDLLQNRLLESTYYLHSRPPLFNLFPGAILKAFPLKYEPSIGINYNYIGYVDVSKVLFHDALRAIWTRPYDYAKAVMNSLQIYLSPASDYPYLQANRERIYRLDHSPDRFTWGQRERKRMVPFVVIWFGIALMYGAATLVGWAIRPPADVSAAATILFLWLTIVYVTALAGIFESVETNRIRFLVDPYILVIGGVALNGLLLTIPRLVKRNLIRA